MKMEFVRKFGHLIQLGTYLIMEILQERQKQRPCFTAIGKVRNDFAKFTLRIMRRKETKPILYMEELIMENKTTINEMATNRYVITSDGIRMTYEEYLDMVRSNRD